MDELDVKLESVFYESAVADLVELTRIGFALGSSRELLLVATTSMLLETMSTMPQLASLAAMSVVMQAEKNRDEDPVP